MSAARFTWTQEVAPRCELGMSDERQGDPDSWLDVTCYVHEAETFNGRDRFTQRFEPGTASVTFDNRSGWGDLVGSPAVVATQTLRPGRQIRIGIDGPWGVDGATATRWIWYGWIDQAAPGYDPVLHDIVTCNCIDALGESGSTTLLNGPLQGENETVDARLHRTLDAGEWFAAKRIIEASTVQVIGTELGAAVIDMLSQAADSAGGVVFGDLDGNVVYKGIDWMLYDPDVPPDFSIGNVDPGTPGIPYVPGYVDPTQGYVYFPDPPPLGDPTVLTVCAEAGDGTLVAQGDAAHLYVEDGQLRFASSGRVWDMGNFDGGCVAVSHDPTSGDPPERHDPPPGEEGPFGPGVPGTPIPSPVLSVELLAYSDGGATDGPQASVTLPAITPGAGALLVLFVSGICEAGALSPFTITGGGLDWQLVEQMVAGADGAESYIYACVTPRTDPGTFPVTLDWMTTRTSRYHAVTLWRINGARADMYDRLLAGIAARAVTNDYPDNSTAPPGTGAYQLELVNDAPIAYVTTAADITIAQSLAEDDTGPFGATFDDTDGAWTVAPDPSGGGGAAGSLGEATDDFERADGPVGSNWSGTGFSIESGAAVIGPPGSTLKRMYWHETLGPDQMVAVEVDNLDDPDFSYVNLLTHGNLTDLACQGVEFEFRTIDVGISLYRRASGGGYTWGDDTTVPLPATPVVLRLESDGDGTQRVYVNDDLVLSAIDASPVSGDHAGVGLSPLYLSSTAESPRILNAWISGGTFCDDFERADGPLGPNWVLGPGPAWATDVIPLTIDAGAAICATNSGEGAQIMAAMHWAGEAPEGMQWVEVEVEDMWAGAGWLSLYTNINGVDQACQTIDFWFDSTTDPDIILIQAYHFEADGSSESGGEVTYPHAATEPIVVRMESDPDGTQRAYIDGALALTWVDPSPVVGTHVGIATEVTSAAPSHVRILRACGSGPGGGGVGPFVAKASWVAGWRPGAVTDNVAWTEVNTGTQDIQSTQAAVVVEGNPLVGFGRRILDYSVHDAGLPGGGTFTRIIRPAPGSVVVVFISAVDSFDVSGALTVTSPGLSFTRQRAQGRSVDCTAQGAIWTAKVPTSSALDTAFGITVAYGPNSVDRLSWVVYEVTGADTVGTTGSGLAGDGSAGSATGPLSITLAAAPAVTSVVLGFLSVAVDVATETGAEPGIGWAEELEYLPPTLAWVQTEAREGSTSTAVEWADIGAGTDAVALAIEVTPADEFVFVFDPLAPVVIGGATVGYTAPIYKAERRTGTDPNGGTVVWKMEPV